MKLPLSRLSFSVLLLGLTLRAADERGPAYTEILKIDSHSHVFEDRRAAACRQAAALQGQFQLISSLRA
jgi:hypothetical protein